MLQQIDFYILPSEETKHAWRLVAKLAEKSLAKKKTLLIRLDNRQTGAQLDEFLWCYKDTSFLPHQWLMKETVDCPIYLTDALLKKTDILVNLAPTIPTEYQQYARIIEIVWQQAVIKKYCRQHYQFYKQQGHSMIAHQLS